MRIKFTGEKIVMLKDLTMGSCFRCSKAVSTRGEIFMRIFTPDEIVERRETSAVMLYTGKTFVFRNTREIYPVKMEAREL